MELTDKLSIAWKRIKKDRRTDFIIGDFEYEVFDHYKDELLDNLKERINKEGIDYSPKLLRNIRVPKTSYTTRPGSIPSIPDRIYYQYLTDEIAHEIEAKLIPVENKIVHSYRYSNSRDSDNMFLFKEASYSTFEEKTIELSKAFNFVVVTDISSYFEKIYHHNLENTLRGLGATHEIVQALMNLLRKWNKGNSYSIPQGIWPSDYLGNVYLDPIDKFMMRTGHNYCRYVDDIRFGVDSYADAQKKLLTLEENLSSIGLTLNDAKTKIIKSELIEDELFPYKSRIDEIKQSILLEIEEKVTYNPYSEDFEYDADYYDQLSKVDLSSSRELFLEQLELDYPNPSIARFCLKQFKKYRDQEVLEDILHNLDRLVVVTPRVVDYLNNIYKSIDSKKNISQSVARYIENDTKYDWQLMWLLQLLNGFTEIENDDIQSVRKIVMSPKGNLHEAVLVSALLFLGKHGDSADGEWVLSQYDINHSSWVRETILYAIRNMPVTKRNHFYNYCIGQDSFLDKIISFVKMKSQ